MNMKRILLLLLGLVYLSKSANAQLDSTKVIDNKGTIKYVLKASNTKIVTQQDSLTLYVTPSQLANVNNNLSSNYVKYSDTTAMLLSYLNNASNGLTKSGKNVKLGGALTEPTTITTDATNLLKIAGLTSGNVGTDSVMVASADGTIKWVSASKLFGALTFGNGLTKNGNNVELGGTLSKPTTLSTSATNTLAIQGLQSGSSADSLVVVGADGTLKRRSQESLLQSGEQLFTATAGQTSYTVTGTATPLPVYTRVWVYRNGAKLIANTDYNISGSNVILTPDSEWSVKVGDKIEVQWVK
jgi:hypothetical protein